ncbi:MAG TPA: Do family serine endopeptidase [Gemmatimonadaceae bacterium]|nr:Do family serine endopeptidase [Gemmatimonadaceae bacterium]
MSSRLLARARLGAIAAAAFAGGLIVAAGFNLTPFGYAQQGATTANRPPARVVEPLAASSNAFVSIAEHVTPAVVSIQTERERATAQRRRTPSVPPGLEDFFEQFDPNRRQQPPAQGSGTGFIVSPDGYILTNNHVVENAERVNVTLLDKRVFRARIVGRDPSTDVAVIKIDGGNLPTVQFGNDLETRIGEWVVAVGNPLGLDFTVTAGIVSAKGRSGALVNLYGSARDYAIVDYIQTDAAINPGNSGGPLVNIRGEVIGINAAIASQTGFYEGYGFAIPITLAKTVMDDLIQHGRVRRAVLGVSIEPVRAEDAQAAGMDEIRGALVGGFTDDASPAQRAGLEPGDVIIAVNGREVDRVPTLQRLVREHEPGETITVDVMRYGKKMSFKVKLAELEADAQVAAVDNSRDEQREDPANSEKLGIAVEPITADLARRAELSAEQRGLLVTGVSSDGAAYQRLFPRGDIILEIRYPAQRKIRSVSDLEQALSGVKSGEIVSLLVYNIEARRTRVENLRIGG